MDGEQQGKLVRLIYVSVMTEACDTEALENILKISRINNQKNGITGVLCYDPTYFLQSLEGPRESINTLYTNISRDTRHQYLTLLEYADIETRLFGDWSMGFVSGGALDRELLDKYTFGGGKFNPFILNGQQVRNFLLDVVKLKSKHMTH
jgi:hypothetical protein